MRNTKKQSMIGLVLVLMFLAIPSLTFADGACCTSSGCVEVADVTTCLMSNGVWIGEGTSCSDDPPPCNGACCTGEGCVDNLDVTTCMMTYSGLWMGPNTSCSDPDICSGACCIGTSCQFITETECANLSGSFSGFGITCDPNPCVQPTGACCTLEGCVADVDAMTCAVVYSGVWMGSETSCSDPDLCSGACCIADTCQVMDPALCSQLNGDFAGYGSGCFPDPCGPTGACCLQTPVGAFCTDMTEEQCVLMGGSATYHGDGTFCDGIDGDGNGVPDLCEDLEGACCIGEDSCLFVTDSECQLAGGEFKGIGTDCSDMNSNGVADVCENSTEGGACCTFMQGCVDVADQATCEGDPYLGQWMGAGTSCSDDPPPCNGACCTETGCVDNVTAMTCLSAHAGQFVGAGTSCSDDPSPCNGACCTDEGCIDGIDAMTCMTTYSGQFMGAGTSCSDPGICSGACCTGETCQFVTQTECSNLSGTFYGYNTTCDPNPCIQPSGACCTPEGCIADVSGITCATVYSGMWMGPGSSCSDPNPCVGACCIDDSCQVLDPGECNLLGGEFLNYGSGCDFNPCGPTGACCTEFPVITICSDMTEEGCAALGSVATFHGVGTYCDNIDGNSNGIPDICEDLEGACCYSDGSCMMQTDEDCQLDGGEFKGIGTDCSTPDICPAPPGLDYLPGDANMAAGSWPPNVIGADVTYLVNYFRAIAAPCLLDGFYTSGDANGDCSVIGADVTYLVQYFRGANELHFCPDYQPSWSGSGDLPTEAPDGWPNCE